MSCGPGNYMELCRLCACFDAIKLEIFGEEGRERNLADKIQTCLPFKVSRTDKLPKSLCYRCMYNLENFYEFRKKSVNAVALLESYIGQPESSSNTDPVQKGQNSRLHPQLHQVKNENEHDIPMPHLEPQETDVIRRALSQEPCGGKRSIAQTSRCSGEVEQDMRKQEIHYDCGICNKTFSSKGELALHNTIHINERSGNKRAKLEPRNRTLHKKADPNWKSGYYRPYHCDLCKESFSTPKHRWGHVSVCHRGDPLVTCIKCSQIFSTCSELEEHRRKKHVDEEDIIDITEDGSDSAPGTLKSSFLSKQSDSFPTDTKKLTDRFSSVQTVSQKTSLNESAIAYTCKLCFIDFQTANELAKHSHCHKQKTTSNSNSRGSHYETRKKFDPLVGQENNKRLESAKSSELVKKLALPGTNSGTSLLKQTLLQNRLSTEGKLRKKSPSDVCAEETRLKRRGLVSQLGGNNGNRRKSSMPRKIARNSDDVSDDSFDEDERNPNSNSCSICHQDFPSLSDLQNHVCLQDTEEGSGGIVSNDKPFTCLLCDKSFSQRNSLSRHFNACHGIDPSEVMGISKYQKQSSKKQETVTMNSAESNELLSKKFDGYIQKSSNQTAVEDDVIETGDSMTVADVRSEQQCLLICEVCRREFGDRGSLWLHLRYTHKEYAAYACGICHHVCDNNAMLNKHWKTAHPPDSTMTDQRRYICQMCGRQHDSRKKLLAHVAIHDLNNGSGGMYDPETLVIVNTRFYKFENTHGSSLEQECSGRISGEDYIKGTTFGCELCYKSFPTEDGLVKHKKCAHKLNKLAELDASGSSRSSYQLYFVCELCGSSHKSKSDRWRHVFRAHNGEPTLTCEKEGCGKVFPTRTLKQEHSTNHHRLQGATPNVCEICGKLWGTRIVFWKHLMGVHPDCVPLTCGVCLKVFCTVTELQTHVQITHLPLTGGDFCCDICGRPYSNKSKLSRHRKIHLLDDFDDSTPNTVSSVKKLHSTSSANIYEKDSHDVYFDVTDVSSGGMGKKLSPEVQSITKPIQNPSGKVKVTDTSVGTQLVSLQPVLSCDACPELTFQSISELADHRRKIHSLHPCDLCSKFYGRTSHLWKHVKRIHNNHPEVTCPLCKRISASKAHLENHIATKHCPKKPAPSPKIPLSMLSFSADRMTNTSTLYPCQKCSRRFQKRYLLRKHQRYCLRKNKLKSFALSNSGSSSFIKDRTCDICSRFFPTPSRLKDHQKTFHAPQHCDLCTDTSFTSKLDLFEHIKENHFGDPNFTCPILQCSRTMRSRLDRDSHHKQHKSEKFPPTCYLCGEVCLSKSRLWNHLNSVQHKDKIPLICGACFKYLPSTEELDEHIQTDHVEALEAPDTCRLCVRSYSSIYKVMDHFTKSHPSYHACKECLSVFKTKMELQDHNNKGPCKVQKEFVESAKGDDANSDIEIVDETDSELLENKPTCENGSGKKEIFKHLQLFCELCDETFLTSTQFGEHNSLKHKHDAEVELMHDSEDAGSNRGAKRPRRTYSCEKCSLSFPSPSDLSDHKARKHTPSSADLKPYHCGCCEKHFTNKTSYWKHINSSAHRAQRTQQNFIMPLTETVEEDVILMLENDKPNITTTQNQSDIISDYHIPDSNFRDNLTREMKSENNSNSTFQNPKKYYLNTQTVADEDLSEESISMDYSSEDTVSYDIEEISNCDIVCHKNSESSQIYRDKSHSDSFLCQLCRKEWSGLKHLWQHMIRNHRQEAAVTCGVCLEVCSDYHELSSHLTTQHPNNFIGEGRNFTCRICGRHHRARSKLIKHAAVHIILGPEAKYRPQSHLLNCQKCFKSFTTEMNLSDHQLLCRTSPSVTKSALNEKRTEYECEVCSKVCGNIGALMTHRKTHSAGYRNTLNLSELETDESENMEEQFDNTDNAELFYTCEFCFHVFESEVQLSEHRKSHSEASGEDHFTMPPGIRFLVPMIERQNLYICDICALVFLTEENLATHSKTHSISSDSDCSSLFGTDASEDLGNEEKLFPEDTYPCYVCSTIFESSFILSTHLEVYHNKKYICTICKKRAFSSYFNLVKHRRFCTSKNLTYNNVQSSCWQVKKRYKKSNYMAEVNKVFQLENTANGCGKPNLTGAEISVAENDYTSLICVNDDTSLTNVKEYACVKSFKIQECDISETGEQNIKMCEDNSESTSTSSRITGQCNISEQSKCFTSNIDNSEDCEPWSTMKNKMCNVEDDDKFESTDKSVALVCDAEIDVNESTKCLLNKNCRSVSDSLRDFDLIQSDALLYQLAGSNQPVGKSNSSPIVKDASEDSFFSKSIDNYTMQNLDANLHVLQGSSLDMTTEIVQSEERKDESKIHYSSQEMTNSIMVRSGVSNSDHQLLGSADIIEDLFCSASSSAVGASSLSHKMEDELYCLEDGKLLNK